METHQRTLPLMGPHFSSEAGLKAVMDQMIKALMAQLPSKNDELRYLGQTSIDATMQHIGIRTFCVFVCEPLQVRMQHISFVLASQFNDIINLRVNCSRPSLVSVTELQFWGSKHVLIKRLLSRRLIRRHETRISVRNIQSSLRNQFVFNF